MKIVIAMDSFKGSLTSIEAGNAVRDGILMSRPDPDIKVFPTADGGEGTIDAIAPFINCEKHDLKVTGPLGEPVDSYYIFSKEEKTAYVEMAKASGLTLISPEKYNPYEATTFGTGELIKDAIKEGAERIVVFLGGSATNDGGAGMLQALGCKLSDKDGNEIGRGAAGLADLASVESSGIMGRGIDFIAATDVINPLCGTEGASYVYGPQKGASPDMLPKLDSILRSFADISAFDPNEKGTGAAGGTSFALMNFLGAKLESGADIVTKITGLEDAIRNADIVITGEGRIDSQTLKGKAPVKIMKTAKQYGKKAIAVCGITGDGWEECLKAGFDRIVPLTEASMDKDKAIKSVIETAANLFA